MTAIRVLLADDHPLVCEGLRVVLAAQPDVTVVGEAATAGEAQGRCAELRPDVLLLDLRMPGPPPAETLAFLRARSLPTRVVILTGHQDREVARSLVRQGVGGYVLKGEPGEAVVHAVRVAAEGGMWLSPAVAAALADEPDRLQKGSALTKREHEVLVLLAQGVDVRHMAEALGVREQTVRNYLRSLYDKLGVHSQLEAALWARDHGLDRPC